MSGDLQGYVWGRTGERVEVPIVNERERQTYYGALDLLTGQCEVLQGNQSYLKKEHS